MSDLLDAMRATKRLMEENDRKPPEPVKFYAAGPNSAELARRLYGPDMPIVMLPRIPRR